jgi:PBSX family phage terminase large subunit
MTKQQTIKLYPQQGAFVGSAAYLAAFIGGIGSGKSTAGAVRALLAAYGQVGTRRIATPNLGMMLAPTYTMLRDAALRTFVEVADGAVSDFNRTEMRLRLDNGSEILLRSTDDPDRLRGPNLSYAWLDEAALMPYAAWTIMLGRLREQGARGSIWATSTPRGRGWLYNVFVRDAAAKPDTFLVRAHSADNTFLDASVVQAWQAAYAGDLARQELEGEFVSYRGLVYDAFDPTRHVVEASAGQIKRVVAGMDFGFSNPGAIIVLGGDADDNLTVLHEAYATQRKPDDWLAIAQALLERRWNPQNPDCKIERFYCDPADPDSIGLLQAGGVPALAADNRVLPGIVAVQRRLAGVPGLHVRRSCVNLLREFERYEWDSKADARPLKKNDHALDALRYAVMGYDQPGRKPLTVNVGRYL